MRYLAVDVGSMTCKYVYCTAGGDILAQAYARHDGQPAQMVLHFLRDLEANHGLSPGSDRLLFTGSGCGFIAPLVGGRIVQEVVAVAAAVEARHPRVRFVSEIGGEDMKTVFLSGEARNKQVLMQNVCSGGTGAFIEKTARRFQIPLEQLARTNYDGRTLHKISAKCGIFAETDANTLLKAGVAVDDIVASLFEAVVYQNLATLTKGSTPLPDVLLLGGPNAFFIGLQQAWRRHLAEIWRERNVALPEGRDPDDLIHVPQHALYYAALGCVEIGRSEPQELGIYRGAAGLQEWIDRGQHAEKLKMGGSGLWQTRAELGEFLTKYTPSPRAERRERRLAPTERVVIGCDFGSVTAKAVCLSLDREIVFSCYTLSKGNPIEDAKHLFHQLAAVATDENVCGVGITGYGKDLLAGIIGADCPIVETVAHASGGMHFFADADCICDVGGTDVKIIILSNGAVSDFRLNSQCSSGNGAFLQGVAERFNIPLTELATHAFAAQAMPRLTMGCGVFLQSDIINQQRKGWHCDEIVAGVCAILPLNVWIYAGGLANLKQVGRKFVLQGGTHRNLAVVKSQVDFIRSKVPGAEVVVHPYPGEAGALGAALVAREWMQHERPTQFRGLHVLEQLNYRTITSATTRCGWCDAHCQRTFVDVELPGGKGRPWSKVPLSEGWERVIVNNSCPKGLIEDAHEVKAVKDEIEWIRHVYPNIAQMVCLRAFRAQAADRALTAAGRDSASAVDVERAAVLDRIPGGDWHRPTSHRV